MSLNWLKNLKDKPLPYIALVLILSMIFEQIFATPLALQAQFNPLRANEEKLVLVLAEEDLMKINKVERLVKRYSQDIQAELDKTTVSILEVKTNESPGSIASLLKQVYFGNTNTFESRNLEGIVVIGEVPLPVIDKQGYRFVSMYPYTDFEDPYYSYEESTGYFRPGELNDFEPEIWHGLIQFENADEYEIYFDKNHAFYEGDEEFTDFDQNIFYADPSHDAEGLNTSLVKNYQNFLNYMEEIAYNRISKELSEILAGSMREEVEKLDIALGELGTGLLTAAINAGGEAPDVYTKNQITKSFSRISELFAKSLADQKQAILGTGRYTENSYITPIKAAALKDEYMMNYFVLLNQMLEKNIDSIVDEIQTPIRIPKGAKFEGNILTFNPPRVTGSGETLSIVPGPIFSSDTLDAQYFVNNGLDEQFARRVQLFTDDASEFLSSADNPERFIGSLEQIVGGINISRITSGEQCRFYKGGRIDTPLSKTVEIKRGSLDGICYQVWEGRDDPDSWKTGDAKQCNGFYGENLRDEYRPELIETENKSLMTSEACFNFRSYQDYVSLLGNVDLEKAEQVPSASDFRLTLDGISINFAQLFSNVEEFKGKVSEWNSWGSYFMGNTVNQVFKSVRPLGGESFDININGRNISVDEVREEGIQNWETFVSRYLEEGETLNELRLSRSLSAADVIDSVNFTFKPIAQTNPVTSVVYHKNPDADALTKAMENPNASDLPIDDVRHVTFMGKDGNTEEIIYPNIFDATSLTDFRRQVVELERRLTEISGINYSNRLTSFITGTDDEFTEDSKLLNRASSDTVSELIEWRNLSINQKYAKIIKSLLNSDESTNTSLPTSFEIAVINSHAGENGFEFEILQDSSPVNTTEESSILTRDFSDAHESQENERERINNRITKISDDDRVPFNEWFGYLKNEWFPSVLDIAGETTKATRPQLDSYEDAIGDFNSEISKLAINVFSENQTIAGPTEREIEILALNEEGQKVVGKSAFATLKITGATFAEGTDEKPDEAGVQVFMVTGSNKVSIVPQRAGRVDITATLNDLTITESVTFHNELNLTLTQSSSTAQVEGQPITLRVSLTNERNAKVRFGEPQLSFDNKELFELSKISTEEYALEHIYELKPLTKSGRVNLTVNYSGTTSASKEFVVIPGVPSQLFFESSSTKVNSQDLSEQTLKVSILDAYSNLVKTNLDNINVSVDSPDKINISSENISIREGRGEIKFSLASADLFGNVFLRVQKTGLTSAYHKIILSNNISYEDLKKFKNTALYYDLKSSNSEYKGIAQSLLVNGKTQVVSTFTAGINDSKPIFYVHRTGALEILDNSNINVVTSLNSTEITTDILDNQERKFARVSVNPSSIAWKGIPEGDITEEPGIFLFPQNQSLTVDGNNINNNGTTVAHIGSNGVPVIDEQGIIIKQKNSQGFFTLEILDRTGLLAELVYNFESAGQVRVIPIEHPEIKYKEGITLPSSTMPEGLIFYNPNTKLSRSQLPNAINLRDEQFEETELIGLREGDKSVLLFAAGQNAGLANRPYLSEIGIVVGDPVISLPRPQNSSLISGYGYDIGKYLGRSDSDINAVLDLDNQLIFGDRNGNVSIYDKVSKNFQKNVLYVPAGIKEMHKFNLEGRRTDILILTEEECVNNDSCVYIMRNNELTRVDIDIDGKAMSLMPADYNGDGDDDLALLTSKKNIVLYINTDGEILSTGSNVGSTGADLNETQNMINEVWLSDPSGTQTIRKLVSQSQSSSTAQSGGQIINTTATPPEYQSLTFTPLTIINGSPFTTSTLYRRDINGGILRDGDKILYTLTLTASSGSYANRSLSIPITSNLTVLQNTLTDGYEFEKFETGLRELIINGLNISSGQSKQITFEAVYSPNENEQAAIVQIVTDENGYQADSLPDFKIQVPGADSTVYYYSVYDRASNRLRYERLEKTLATTNVADTLPQIPDLTNPEEASQFALDLEERTNSQDSDGDGIADSIDTLNSGLNSLASGIEGAIDAFRCGSGGCIATPINYAFLVPNGIPVPVFGWGCGVPPVLAGTPAYLCTGGKFYLSPTLTGELAAALCVGTMCWTTSIADLGSLCDTINAGIQDLMTRAANAVSGTIGNAAIVTDSTGSSDDALETSTNVQVPGFPSVITDWVSAQYEEIQRKLLKLPELTIIYPSPASIAAGFKPTETENELDTEDLNFDNIAEILAKVHAMPLFDIKLESQIIKYPYINPEEFNKYKTQFEEIKRQNVAAVYRAFEQWKCYGSEMVPESELDKRLKDGDLEFSASVSNECVTLGINATRLFVAFDTNLEILEKYRDLPRNIFEAENFLADYASQLLGYVDKILETTAGYIARNTARLEQWQQTFIDIQNLIDSLSAILDLSADYMNACDDCRSSRSNGGSFQVLLNLFLQIPSPPVIPIPSLLPDITIDISQIDAQVDIVLPKFEFEPDNIVLPDLKNFIIVLPDAPPLDLSINPGKYGLGLFPQIPSPPDIGALIIDLPALPDLKLPKLPDIPKAPSLEGPVTDFMAEFEVVLDTLSIVLRIVCLLRSGFIPIQENQLRTQIQEITARPLTPVLPIDIGLGFQLPDVEITYLQELRLILETNLTFDFGLLNRAASLITDKFNEFESNLNQGIEDKLNEFRDASNPLGEEFKVPGTDELNDLELDATIDLQSFKNNLNTHYSSLIKKSNEIENLTPDEITLVAEQEDAGELKKLAYVNLDRNFDLPPALINQVNKIIAYKNNTAETFDSLREDIRLIASTDEINNSDLNTQTTTFRIAQAGLDGVNNEAQFTPEGGIYIYNSETEQSENVVRYNAEPNTNVKVNLSDIDDDGDEDMTYTRGKEIFIKENLKDEPRKSRNTARVETHKFEDLKDEIGDLVSITSNQFKASAKHKSVTLSIPVGLDGQNIIIDVYESNLQNTIQNSRFVMESTATQSDFKATNRVELANGQRITKDGFDTLYYKGGYSQTITLPLENKTYQIAVMVANQSTNKFDVLTAPINTTPNICSDESPPDINVLPDRKIQSAILKPVNIDLSTSTDSETEIAKYYLDTNIDIDTDGDGNPTNDRVLISTEDRVISRFRLAASETEKNYSVMAWAIDLAGNLASTRIDIEVVIPKISINELTQTEISGQINPPNGNVELTIVRDRNGLITELGNVTTDDEGGFSYTNLEDEGNYLITDANGNELFEINETTGSVIPKHSSAKIEVIPARAGSTPTTILLKKNDAVITKIVRVPDSNNDVQVVETKPPQADLLKSTEVYIIDTVQRDDFSIRTIPGNESGYSGGAEITKNGSRQMIIDVDGSLISTNTNLGITLEPIRNINSAQWFGVYSSGTKIAEIYVGTGNNNLKFTSPDLTPREGNTSSLDQAETSTGTPVQTNSPFADVKDNDEDAQVINYLKDKGVVDGIIRDGLTYFEPNRDITRSEYSKIILNTLCIIPREEAYLAPPVFSDIPYTEGNNAWYYPFTKETQLQKFFTGYLGEIHPTLNLPPFKPLNPITRAEAAKVILEALNTQQILDLSEVPVLEPWYVPYMQIATNLSPYLIDADEIRQTFLLTPSEAEVPLVNISRREFAVMAYRALNVKNCLEQDGDNDGLPYYWEDQNNLDPNSNDANNDQDGDGITNKDEFEAGTDPTTSQTRRDNMKTVAGVYIEKIECNTCPCEFSIDHQADIRPGDKVFVILRSGSSGTIYQSSDPITFKP